ncbi:flagellar hook-length control protein FliK [Maridesulfovibrio hydrothermalis]|uniref:Flagellar hook-length control protein n=1 Tax=Maridesulfovibrio hydrothermalis AM13 = DSM 14728 TaxID=1121451 RepID=L0RAR6_9BACT|nr:flagellar hook-length control protein FliK [Maridesulfovibrio hydrothermalis]CCO23844.1 Flagellar hook-length control protein [Maridesulfovibrio hydrothermalis AM13 = DSM 14728]
MKILPHLDQKNQDLSSFMDRTSLIEDSYRSAMFDSFLYSSQSAAETVYQPVEDTVNSFESAYDKAESISYETERAASYIDEAAENVALQAVDEQPQDLQVSREDWNEIKEELEGYGIDKKDIADLEEKVMSENGMTYGQLVSELTGMMKSLKGITLTPVQEQNLNAVFSKLGFSADESKSMLASISQGKMGDVIEKMQSKLAALADAQKIQLTESETSTLSNIFKLSGENGKKIAQIFAAENATAGDLKKGFALIKNALAQQAATQDAKDLKLVKTVGDSLRTAMEKASDQSPSNFRIASAEVITDSMGAAKDVSESVKNAAENAKNNGSESGNSGKDAANEFSRNGRDFDGDSGNGRNMAEADAKHGNRHWLEQALSDSKDVDSWSEFFGKISGDSLLKGDGSLNGNIFGDAIGTLQNAAKAAQAGKANPMWENTARSNVLEQLQEGAFKNLGQGRKQLTLQLNPHNLGTVNVMLQVKNKDVQAVIRAENPETAKVIAEQLEAVKQALEEQGLKVEKLEVQTGISDRETQGSWQNAQDHNQAQYREMMSEMRKRWQILRQEGSSLAQEMQNVQQTATISQSGLYIVA